MSGVVGFAEALRIVGGAALGCNAGRAEQQVSLLAAAGRVLAADVTADRDQPPFDRATRDGFALRAAEFTGAHRLRVIGQVRAGELWTGTALGAGEAVEIMTGAAVPAGADAVAMVEHTASGESAVWAAAGRRLAAGENIVAGGSEARAGDTVVPAGTVIGAAEIAEAATCGCVTLQVFARPKVAIVATGDELVEIEQTPGEREIRNSNSYALAAMVSAAGGEPVQLGIARDSREDLRARIVEGMEHDLLLLSGGVSAGKYDLVEDVLAELGAEFLFTGVRMQPGKPVVLGRLPRRGGTAWVYFFGLPGNPISTQVTFHCFVETIVHALAGGGVFGPRFVQATFSEDAEDKPGLVRLLPALLRYGLERPEVRLVGWHGSGDLAANARANCYAVLPDGRKFAAGDVITVLLR